MDVEDEVDNLLAEGAPLLATTEPEVAVPQVSALAAAIAAAAIAEAVG